MLDPTSLILIKVTCMSWRPLGKTILLEPEIAWQAITRHHFFESYSDFHFWWKSDVSEIGFLPTLSRYFVKSNSRCFWIKSQHRLKDKHRSFLLVTLCNWLAFSSGTRSSSLQWRIWNSDSLELFGILWGCMSLRRILLGVYVILYIILEFIVNFFENSLGNLGTQGGILCKFIRNKKNGNSLWLMTFVEICLNYLGSVGLSGVFWDVLGFFRNLWSSMGFYNVMFMVFIWIFFGILQHSFGIFCNL